MRYLRSRLGIPRFYSLPLNEIVHNIALLKSIFASVEQIGLAEFNVAAVAYGIKELRIDDVGHLWIR